MDDVETLREQVERQKQADEMLKTMVRRKLSFGGDMEDVDPRFEARLHHKFDNFADLVESEVWQDIELVAKLILSKYEVPPSSTIDGRVAYETFNIARDVLNQLFGEIKAQASRGIPEKAEITEEVINL